VSSSLVLARSAVLVLHCARSELVVARPAMGKNPYTVLGLEPTCSDDDIRRAYRREALRWHPDKNPDNPDAAAVRFREVSQAYQVLSDKKRRADFDAYGVIDGDSESDTDSSRESSSDSMNYGADQQHGFGHHRHHSRRHHHNHGHSHFHHAHFVDPMELFRSMFENDPFFRNAGDPFSGFPGGGLFGGGGGLFGGFGGGAFGGGMFGGPAFASFGGMPMMTSSFSSSSSGFGGGGMSMRSQSVQIVNGRRTSVTRIVENGQETVIEEQDGKVISKTVNGVQQLTGPEAGISAALPAPSASTNGGARRTSASSTAYTSSSVSGPSFTAAYPDTAAFPERRSSAPRGSSSFSTATADTSVPRRTSEGYSVRSSHEDPIFVDDSSSSRHSSSSSGVEYLGESRASARPTHRPTESTRSAESSRERSRGRPSDASTAYSTSRARA
jgi:hypothetical protein